MSPSPYTPIDGYGNPVMIVEGKPVMTVEIETLEEKVKEELQKVGDRLMQWVWSQNRQHSAVMQKIVTERLVKELAPLVKTGMIEPITSDYIRFDVKAGIISAYFKLPMDEKLYCMTLSLSGLPGWSPAPEDAKTVEEKPDEPANPADPDFLNEWMGNELQKIRDSVALSLQGQSTKVKEKVLTEFLVKELGSLAEMALIEPVREEDIKFDPATGEIIVNFTLPAVGRSYEWTMQESGPPVRRPSSAPDGKPARASRNPDVPVQIGRFRYLDDC